MIKECPMNRGDCTEQACQIGLKALQRYADLCGVNGQEACEKAKSDSPPEISSQARIDDARSAVLVAAELIAAMKI